MVRLNRQLRFLAALALAVPFVSAPALAGGFAIHEAGAKAIMFGGAFAAQADDHSAMFYNPAGMTSMPRGLSTMMGVSLIFPSVEMRGAAPFPGEGYQAEMKSQIFFPPHLYAAYGVNDRLTLSLGTWFPYGLSTAWEEPEEFAGRFLSQRADLRTYALSVQGAFKLTDWLSIGGGPELRIGDVKLQRNQAAFNPFTNRFVDVAHIDIITDGFDTGLAWTVGVQIKPTSRMKIGASFHSHVDIEFGGLATFYQKPTGNAQFDAIIATRIPFEQEIPASTIIQFPSITMMGLSYDLTDKITLEAGAYYTTWKVFENTILEFDTVDNKPIPTVELVHNWKNTWRLSGGISFSPTEKFYFGAGAVYDQTPQPDSDTSPLLPDANRLGATIGAGVRFGNSSVDVSNMFLWFRDRTTTTNRDQFNATYKNFTDLFLLSLRHQF